MPDLIVAHLISAWYFWISLLVVSLMLLSMTGVCVICCCRDRRHSFVFGRIFIGIPATVLNTARDPEGIIQPDVAFFPRRPSLAAKAQAQLMAKDRLTTPIMPLVPAYRPAQQVTVSPGSVDEAAPSTAGAEADRELTLPPGYVANRDAKYQ